MRTSLLGFAFFVLCLSPTNVGCGGVTTLPASDDAGSSADGAPDSGTGNDAGSGDAGQGSDGGVADCPTMSVELEQLQKQASACCSKCNIVQCTAALPGVCCSISVSSANSQASKDYEALLNVFLQQCHPDCPAILCPKEPSGICGPAGECE
jgi:hypothetical protein